MMLTSLRILRSPILTPGKMPKEKKTVHKQVIMTQPSYWAFLSWDGKQFQTHFTSLLNDSREQRKARIERCIPKKRCIKTKGERKLEKYWQLQLHSRRHMQSLPSAGLQKECFILPVYRTKWFMFPQESKASSWVLWQYGSWVLALLIGRAPANEEKAVESGKCNK